MRRLKKNPFILIEVFLAITFVSLIIIPITSYPYKTYAKEVKTLTSLEWTRLQEVIFADFVRDLPLHLGSASLDEGPIAIDLGTYTCDLSPLGVSSYEATLSVALDKKFTTPLKEERYLLDCTLTLTSENRSSEKIEPISYLISVKKPPPK